MISNLYVFFFRIMTKIQKKRCDKFQMLKKQRRFKPHRYPKFWPKKQSIKREVSVCELKDFKKHLKIVTEAFELWDEEWKNAEINNPEILDELQKKCQSIQIASEILADGIKHFPVHVQIKLSKESFRIGNMLMRIATCMENRINDLEENLIVNPTEEEENLVLHLTDDEEDLNESSKEKCEILYMSMSAKDFKPKWNGNGDGRYRILKIDDQFTHYKAIILVTIKKN